MGCKTSRPLTVDVIMHTPQTQTSNAIRFWKIYSIVMAVDLLLYFVIFYAGRAIPPASPYTSYPGNYALCMGWFLAHFPAVWFFFSGALPERLAWLTVLQDVWLAALIFLWRRRKKKCRLIRGHAANLAASSARFSSRLLRDIHCHFRLCSSRFETRMGS